MCFPEYSEYIDRVKSFEQSPNESYIYQNRKYLAAAGFFFTGKEDETICYYCGGGVKDWQQEDIPWVEHARWLSRCSFLLVNKGLNFIEKHYKNIDTTNRSIKPLEQTRETDRAELQCVVCWTNEKNVFFLPCRHCCVCSDCGMKLTNCVICRDDILTLMEIFLS